MVFWVLLLLFCFGGCFFSFMVDKVLIQGILCIIFVINNNAMHKNIIRAYEVDFCLHNRHWWELLYFQMCFN